MDIPMPDDQTKDEDAYVYENFFKRSHEKRQTSFIEAKDIPPRRVVERKQTVVPPLPLPPPPPPFQCTSQSSSFRPRFSPEMGPPKTKLYGEHFNVPLPSFQGQNPPASDFQSFPGSGGPQHYMEDYNNTKGNHSNYPPPPLVYQRHNQPMNMPHPTGFISESVHPPYFDSNSQNFPPLPVHPFSKPPPHSSPLNLSSSPHAPPPIMHAVVDHPIADTLLTLTDDLPPLPPNSPSKKVLEEKMIGSTSTPKRDALKVKKIVETPQMLPPGIEEDQYKEDLIEDMKDAKSDSAAKDEEKEKTDSSLDPISLAIQKQQIDVASSSETDDSSTKKEASQEKIITPKKLNLPMLGKEGAKKRLKSFSANKAFLRDKPKLQDDGEEKPKASILEAPEDDKKEATFKKKKKNEKVSVIEQIKEEETRIKEVLNYTHSMFSSYGFGMGMPEINNFFDNPEALKKFEARGKDFMEKIEKGQFISPIQKHSKSGDGKDERSSRFSHSKDSNQEKGKEKSSRTREEERKKESRSIEKDNVKPKVKEIPKNWKEMKSSNISLDDLRKAQRSHRRSRSRSISPNRTKKESLNKTSHFPDFPKQFTTLKANCAVSYGSKYFTGSIVQYTVTKPSISYAIDCKKFDSHYWTRRELKLRNKAAPEVLKIIYDFWKLQPQMQAQDSAKDRPWWTRDDFLGTSSTNEAEMMEEKAVTALDYLSSNYEKEESSQAFDKEEEVEEEEEEEEEEEDNEEDEDDEEEEEYSDEAEHKDDKVEDDNNDTDDDNVDEAKEEVHETPEEEEEEDRAHLAKEADKSELKNSVEELDNIRELPETRNSDNKLSAQELNEEYEAFINTLEYKPDESCSTGGLSEDTLDFNSSLLSFDDIQEQGKALKSKKESKRTLKSDKLKELFENVPKTVKEAKRLLLDSKLSKPQRKELKRLKKKLKKEKKERKRLKKELKRKRRMEKKLQKKQEKRDIKLEKEENVSLENVSLENVEEMPEKQNEQELTSVESATHLDENMEDYEVVDWEVYNDDDDDAGISQPSDRGNDSISQPSDRGKSTASPRTQENSNNIVVCSDTSGYYDQSQSSESPICSNSASSVSCYKSVDEAISSNSYQHTEELPDRYSPSNMSVCSVESPIASGLSSPNQYFENVVSGASDYPPSPYSPSSPQSSSSDTAENEPLHSTPSLDTIPMPPPPPGKQTTQISHNISRSSSLHSSSTSFKPVGVVGSEAQRTSSEKRAVEQEVELSSPETTPFKKTFQPVVFRLGAKKQSGGLKLLQKTPLPGFSEEEDRKSPIFDLPEGAPPSKLDKLKSQKLDSLGVLKSISLKSSKILDDETDKDSSNDPESISVSEKAKPEPERIYKRSPSPKNPPLHEDSVKDVDKSHKRIYPSSKDKSDRDQENREISKPKTFSNDSERQGKKFKESESKKEKDYKASMKGESGTSDRRLSSSPKRRKDRRRESSPAEARRKRYSRSPEGSRNSFPKTEHKDLSVSEGHPPNQSFKSRSRSPYSRSADRSGGGAYQERYLSPPPRFDDKVRDTRRDSRSQSPSPKWRRIKSPPPKRYKESLDWSHGQDEERSRYSYREEERSGRSLNRDEDRSISREDDRSERSLSRDGDRLGRSRNEDRSRRSLSRDEERSGRSLKRDDDRHEERSRSSYSPRNRKRRSSRSNSPENSSRRRSPDYGFKDAPKRSSPEDYSSYSPRPIDAISNRYDRTDDIRDDWDWADSSKTYYPGDNVSGRISPRGGKDGVSPSISPKRLSLDERLKQEHGVEIEEEQLAQGSYPRQGYYWEFNPPPSLPMVPHQPPPSAKAQVIRVGNVLQVLPQDSSPEKPVLLLPPPEHAYNVGIPPPVPKIVQTGNVIQVVPTDNFQTPSIADRRESSESASSTPALGHSEEPQHPVSYCTPPPAIKPLSEIAPVPPPSSTPTSNPLAFISSLLASSMSQPITSSTSCATLPPVLIPVLAPEVPQKDPHTQIQPEEKPKPAEVSIPILDSQQQQAIISAAVAAAASGVTASNLPIAHLISVLQQQSLLIQPSVPLESVSNPPRADLGAQAEGQGQAPELRPQIDLETFRQQRRERKERKRKEREQRRKARREKALRKRLEQQQQQQQKEEEEEEEEEAKAEVKNDSFDEDDAVFKEAITEVPELGSPIPDYEIYNDDDLGDEDDDEEGRKPPFLPLPLPPEKGILIGPTYRIIRNKERKSVSFADGVMPGYGTSPSGGEEIHSPPPQIFPEKEKKKKLRKKKKVKVRIIKQYVLGDSRMDSPPPPPETPPTPGTLKLYPGCTHYTCTAPGTFVIYTQQPVKVNGSNLGLAVGSTVTIPPGMLIHSSALSKRWATGTADEMAGISTGIPSAMPQNYPVTGFTPYFGDSRPQDQGSQPLQSPVP